MTTASLPTGCRRSTLAAELQRARDADQRSEVFSAWLACVSLCFPKTAPVLFRRHFENDGAFHLPGSDPANRVFLIVADQSFVDSRRLQVQECGGIDFIGVPGTHEFFCCSVRVLDRRVRINGVDFNAGCIGDVSCHPASRRLGLATSCLNDAIAFMEEHRFDLSTLHTGSQAPLYAAVGWQSVTRSFSVVPNGVAHSFNAGQINGTPAQPCRFEEVTLEFARAHAEQLARLSSAVQGERLLELDGPVIERDQHYVMTWYHAELNAKAGYAACLVQGDNILALGAAFLNTRQSPDAPPISLLDLQCRKSLTATDVWELVVHLMDTVGSRGQERSNKPDLILPKPVFDQLFALTRKELTSLSAEYFEEILQQVRIESEEGTMYRTIASPSPSSATEPSSNLEQHLPRVAFHAFFGIDSF